MRIVLYLLAACALVYGSDWALAAARPRFQTLHVDRFMAIREKFNKVSYEPAGVQEERCIEALFPHMGSRPCWYVARHRSEIVDLD